jgi:hypothetical protein
MSCSAAAPTRAQKGRGATALLYKKEGYLIENREAAVGCRCFTCGSAGGLRCGGRKRRSSLVGGLKCAVPGWEEAESRRAADTAAEASWRSHASGAGSGGGLGGDISWGAGYGGDVGRVDRRWSGCVGELYRHIACWGLWGEGPCFLLGRSKLRCLACSDSRSQK